ncbi:MAG: hypothetical protein IKI72_03345 [Bacteroidales bacterium]|nr:hypothetical protein [Bacteroidales bacterium]
MKMRILTAVLVCSIFGAVSASAQQARESSETLNKVLRPAVSIVVNGDRAVTQTSVYNYLRKEGVPVSKGKIMKAEATMFNRLSPQYLNVYALVQTVDKKLQTQKVSILLSTGAGDDAPFISPNTDKETVDKLKDLLENSFVPFHNDFVKETNIGNQEKVIAASNKKLKSLEKELDRLNSSVEKTKSLIEKQRQTIAQQEEALKDLKK